LQREAVHCNWKWIRHGLQFTVIVFLYPSGETEKGSDETRFTVLKCKSCSKLPYLRIKQCCHCWFASRNDLQMRHGSPFFIFIANIMKCKRYIWLYFIFIANIMKCERYIWLYFIFIANIMKCKRCSKLHHLRIN
jgi:hypothetical protein